MRIVQSKPLNYAKLFIGWAVVYATLIFSMISSIHAERPEDNFPDKLNGMEIKGIYVRKGTIGASFKNAMALDKLLVENGSDVQIAQLMEDQRPLGRGLFVLDVFEMLPVKVWLEDPQRQGRILVAVMTLQVSPELVTDAVKARLKEILPSAHPVLVAEIAKVL